MAKELTWRSSAQSRAVWRFLLQMSITMRLRLVVTASLIALACSTLRADEKDAYPYHVEIVDQVLAVTREKEGKKGLYITAKFKILHTSDNKPALDIGSDEIRVLEEGKPVADLV